MLNQRQLGNRLGLHNIASFTQYYSPEHKRKIYKIQDCDDYHPCRTFLDKNVAIIMKMNTRRTLAVKFRTKSRFNQHDPILTK